MMEDQRIAVRIAAKEEWEMRFGFAYGDSYEDSWENACWYEEEYWLEEAARRYYETELPQDILSYYADRKREEDLLHYEEDWLKEDPYIHRNTDPENPEFFPEETISDFYSGLTGDEMSFEDLPY